MTTNSDARTAVTELPEPPLMVSMRRFTEGMSHAQIGQLRDLCAIPLAALNAYLASPRSAAMHPLVARQFTSERAHLQRMVFHLDRLQSPAATDNARGPAASSTALEYDLNDPDIAATRNFLRDKSPADALQLRTRIVAELKTVEASIVARGRIVDNPGSFALQRDQAANAVRRKIIGFLDSLLTLVDQSPNLKPHPSETS